MGIANWKISRVLQRGNGSIDCHVEAIGIKEGNLLFIRGRRVDL
jgi:hypothetical protein